jgi:hypothetical protein
MPQILQTTAALAATVEDAVVVVTAEDMAVVGMAVVDGVVEGAAGVVVEGDGKGAIEISNPQEKESNALGLRARDMLANTIVEIKSGLIA